MKKRIVSILLCVALCSSLLLTACTNDSETKKVGTGKAEKLEETGDTLIANGKSSYKIVLPAKANETLTFAAQELQNFLKQATGAVLEIVTDKDVSDSDKVISLGQTKTAENLGVEATKEDNLKTSGYMIKTVDQNVVIIGTPGEVGYGVLYGVYDFLYDTIKLKVYAADEIVYEEKNEIPLYEYDNTVNPSFDKRSLSYQELLEDEAFRNRTRTLSNYVNPDWGMSNGHSQPIILPYNSKHPEWYSSDRKQLCWSAGEEAEEAFANGLIRYIKLKKDSTTFMIGQADYSTLCGCTKCMDNLEKYGNYAGIQIVWANSVIEKVEKWLKKNDPDRDIKYVVYAYQSTLTPPVKKGSDGNWVVFHEDCAPHEKLYFYFAQLGINMAKPLDSSMNKGTLESLKKWGDIADGNVMPYLYDFNASHLFVNFNDFDVMQEHLQTYKDNGADYVNILGATRRSSTFSELRTFVDSQLMWDLSLNYDDLVNEFMGAYYADAATAMRKFYDTIRKNYKGKEEKTGGVYSNLSSSEIYSMEVITELDACIDEALEAIEPLRDKDNERYETLYYRIKEQQLTCIWLKLEVYNFVYSPEQLSDLAKEFHSLCSKLNLEWYTETTKIEDRFKEYIQ